MSALDFHREAVTVSRSRRRRRAGSQAAWCANPLPLLSPVIAVFAIVPSVPARRRALVSAISLFADGEAFAAVEPIARPAPPTGRISGKPIFTSTMARDDGSGAFQSMARGRRRA